MKSKVFGVVFVCLLFAAFSSSAQAAPPYTFKASLARTSPTFADAMGTASAISSDGSRIVAGTTADTIGLAVVFRRGADGTYVEEADLKDVAGAAYDYLSMTTFALSADGSVAVLGGYGRKVTSPPDNDYQGYAVVFRRTGTTWEKVQTITRASPGYLDSFGISAALSADGSQLAIGASGARGPSGEAFQGLVETYSLNNSTGLYEHGQTLRASDGVAQDSYGGSVSLDSAGTRLAVGSEGKDGGKGAVYIYEKSGTWGGEQKVQRVYAPEDNINDHLGSTLALSGDGKSFVAGANNDKVGSNFQQGSASVFALASGTWGEEVRLIDNSGAENDYGPNSVDISSNGGEVSLGFASSGAGNGKVQIHSRDSQGSWSLAQTLTDTTHSLAGDADGGLGDNVGASVALAADGNTVIAGATAAGDVFGNNLGRMVVWTDQTAPAPPTITSSPSSPSITDVTFEWSGDADTASYLCSIDSGAEEACTSGKTYNFLSDGSHTFSVKAKDAAGNVSAAATHTWSVDATPPAVPTIDSGPPSPTNDSTPSFSFSGDPESVFRCKIDDGSPSNCTSPFTAPALADGPHTFRVFARDALFNQSAAASQTFVVDTVSPSAPVITSKPDPFSNALSASVAFTSPEASPTFLCAFAGTESECISPVTYSSLGADGAKSVAVKVRDAAGNVSPAATAAWVKDTARPVASFVQKPAKRTSSRKARFKFGTNETGAMKYTCKYDANKGKLCGSTTHFRTTPGRHTMTVTAEDAAGNVSAAIVWKWTVIK